MAAGPPNDTGLSDGGKNVGRLIRTWCALAVAALAAACATVPDAPAGPSLDAIEASLARDIATLSDDSFAGRYPGTPGEAKTRAWLIDRFVELGLQPGAGDGDWTQDFTLVRHTPATEPGSVIAGATRAGRSLRFSDAVLAGQPGADRATIADVPMVGLAPDVETLRPGALANRALVLPASELARLGGELETAEPKVIVLTSADRESHERAARLFESGRWRLDSDKRDLALMLLSPEDSARLRGLIGSNARRHPDGLGVISYDTILDLRFEQAAERIDTANIIGRLPGTVEGAGAVLLLAHWDHLGDQCGPPAAQDRLCNGAVDNASGLAVMAEALRLATREGPLERDLIVLATSAEELGLLGAEAFVADAPVPLPTIAAAFNFDTMAVAPRGAPVVAVGAEETPLAYGISEVARSLRREVVSSAQADAFLRRQDGWVFLREGVPAVWATSTLADEKAFEAFLEGPYHGAGDEFGPALEMGGAAEDVLLHAGLIRYFGSLQTYPGAAG